MDVLEVDDAEPMEATPACDEIGVVKLAGAASAGAPLADGAFAACTSAGKGEDLATSDLTDSEPEDSVFAVADPVYADVDLSMFVRANATADSSMFVNADAGADSSLVNAVADANSSLMRTTSACTDSEPEDSAGPSCAGMALSMFGRAKSVSSLLLRTKASY